jgi:phosphatidylserine/phosphatidylglycerophosphate/cardiolipin synthase-like enzyme
MRNRSTSGALTVRAIAGTHVVLLAMSVEPDAVDGLLGFTIERSRGKGGKKEPLPNFLIFEENAGAEEPDHSSAENPFQAFQWCDYAAAPGSSYTYFVTARYGTPTDLKDRDSVEIEIETEDPDQGRHGIYFNRGAAGWQAYQRHFGQRDPDQVPDRGAYKWLSRGLEEALLAFIAQADGEGWGLRASLYEFNCMPILDALWGANRRGVDVEIVVDEMADEKDTTPQPKTKNVAAITVGEIENLCTPRTRSGNISHNKFVVLLRNEKPVEVWTGSTNVTKGGIFGHSNVGHLVRDPAVAAAYLAYWEELVKDPVPADLKDANRKIGEQPEDRLKATGEDRLPAPSSVDAVFSPRSSLAALEWYAELLGQATESAFLTAPFGVSAQLAKVFEEDRDYPRYLILDKEDKRIAPVARKIEKDLDNEVAVGAYLGEGNWHGWLEEHLTGFNDAVLFVHTKYLLVDPLGEDPIVITGSANFSTNSTQNNDENSLVIRGDKGVADVYVTEFMRLFTAFRLRKKANAELAGQAAPNPSPKGPAPAEPLFLEDDDGWAKPYYAEGLKKKERLFFSGSA